MNQTLSLKPGLKKPAVMADNQEPKTPFAGLVGKPVRVHCRTGMAVVGILDERRGGYLRIRNATITPRDDRDLPEASTPLAIINESNVGLVYAVAEQ